MKEDYDDFDLFEQQDTNAKKDRRNRLETQRKIYELKEQQRLKRDNESYHDWD